MIATELHDHIAAHAELVLHSVEGGVLRVNHPPTKAGWELTPDVLEHEWAEVEAVLTGRRASRILRQMTRIVGYYAMVDNFNRGKLGELDARRRGNYALPERSA